MNIMKKSFLPILFTGYLLIQSMNPVFAQKAPDEILLRDFRPVSIYEIPVSDIRKARYPIIDVHSHPYASSSADVDQWVRNMDSVNVDRTVILTYSVGERLDSLMAVYNRYPDRYDVWCGLDLANHTEAGFTARAVAELERCREIGGKGIGELSDKGWGVRSGNVTGHGLHLDNPLLQPVLKRAGELGLPVNIHVADPIWMYMPMDSTNDGMMNAFKWRLDDRSDIVGHSGMIDILERAVSMNPETIFIAVHFANLSYDLNRLADMLDKYPNLYADISARYAETATIPRFMRDFYIKYQDRLLYGTDMGYARDMYRTTFRILESADEHFYDHNLFSYHWALNGFELPDEVLRKIYRDNALKLFESARR
jgi:uncharacterized protein